MKALVLGILASLVLTPLVVSQVPNGKLIVPGQRIGQWTLAMTIDGLVRQKGPVVTTHRPADGDAREGMTEFLWGVQFADPQQLRGDKVELIAGTRDRKKIEYLSLRGIVDLRTIKGVRVGDFWTSIEAAHGRPSATTKWTGPEWTGRPGIGTFERWIYDGKGLAFWLATGSVRRIYVFRPGTAKQLWRF